MNLLYRRADGTPNNFFFVYITKNDPQSVEKLTHIFKKLENENYRLDLDIISFSAEPNGSQYMSESVTFKNGSIREPNGTKSRQKTKPKNKLKK